MKASRWSEQKKKFINLAKDSKMVAGSSWFCLAPENSYQKDEPFCEGE